MTDVGPSSVDAGLNAGDSEFGRNKPNSATKRSSSVHMLLIPARARSKPDGFRRTHRHGSIEFGRLDLARGSQTLARIRNTCAALEPMIDPHSVVVREEPTDSDPWRDTTPEAAALAFPKPFSKPARHNQRAQWEPRIGRCTGIRAACSRSRRASLRNGVCKHGFGRNSAPPSVMGVRKPTRTPQATRSDERKQSVRARSKRGRARRGKDMQCKAWP